MDPPLAQEREPTGRAGQKSGGISTGWASYCSFEQKRATLSACLKKVHSMASDADAVYASGLQKLDEFRRLAYPRSVLRGACTYMAACTGSYAWIRVRHVVDTWYM